MAEKLNIAVACGGTGGHTFPGVATAQELVRRGHEVTLWVAGRAIEAETIKGWEGALYRTGAVQLRLQPRALALTLCSLWRAHNGLRQQHSNVVLAMGSYASLAPVVAASRAGVPVVLHEANAVPGKAIERLSRFAAAVAVSYTGSVKLLHHRQVVPTGLPVRTELLDEAPFDGFATEQGFTILVTGGSQGAHVLNQVASEAFVVLSRQAETLPLRIIHQTGKADEATVRATYAAAGVEAHVVPFVTRMGGAFKAADLVIARAGAATCAELALFGLPSLLVPLPSAVRDHQRANAAHLHQAGAADLCLQDQFTVDFLVDHLQRLMRNQERRSAMRQAALSLAQPQAACQLADLVEATAAGREKWG